MPYQLVQPSLSDRRAFLAYLADWTQQPLLPGAVKYQGQPYECWLAETRRLERHAPADLVPAHLYFLVDTLRPELFLGAINIRHRLNAYLLAFGGHIGYAVSPSHRRKGYAKAMLRLGLGRAEKLGLDCVLITCDRDNIGSAKTILACGGQLENEVLHDGAWIQRYWVNTRQEAQI